MLVVKCKQNSLSSLANSPVECADGSRALSAEIDRFNGSDSNDSSYSPCSIDFERILDLLSLFLIVPKKSLFFLLLPLSTAKSNPSLGEQTFNSTLQPFVTLPTTKRFTGNRGVLNHECHAIFSSELMTSAVNQ